MKRSRFTNYSNFILLIAFFCFAYSGCGKESSNVTQTNINSNGDFTNKRAEFENKAETLTSENKVIEKIDEPIFGITTDTLPEPEDGEEFKKLTDTIDAIGLRGGRKPMIRVNIDYDDKDKLKHYVDSIEKLKSHASIMVNLSDSHDMYNYSTVDEFRLLVRTYLENLGQDVAVWEIGNEVNGEWVGWKTDGDGNVIIDGKKIPFDKMDEKLLQHKREFVRDQIDGAYQEIAAYEKAKKKDLKIALTLYYNDDGTGHKCWEKSEYEMFNWTTNYVNADLKRDLDYVFISFYEDKKDCPILSKKPKTDTLTWIRIFKHLGTVFTSDDAGKGKLGFGEFAPQCHDCGDRSCCQADKKEFITRYYSTYHKGIVAANIPKYVGGFFYWYFYQDMVESENKDAFKEMQKIAKSY